MVNWIVAMPWPAQPASQPRVLESLQLQANPENLLLCKAQEDDVPGWNQVLLNRNSILIGGSKPRCFIADMVRAAIDFRPEAEWFGFGNSDCVLLGPPLESAEQEILLYHRIDVRSWDDLFHGRPKLDKNLENRIWRMRAEGIADKKIASILNIEGVLAPEGQEWTYSLIQDLLARQGTIFFWGVDLFLFRKDVVQRVLSEYLDKHDPVLSTGVFDTRLARWCLDHFRTKRVTDRLYHQIHNSEWLVNEPEYEHNGGNMSEEENLAYLVDIPETLYNRKLVGVFPREVFNFLTQRNPHFMHSLSNSS